MQNKITYINVGSHAIYFLELEAPHKKNQKNTDRLIQRLKKYIIKSNGGRPDLSDSFILEINSVACLVCANAKLSMATIANMIKNGEDTPFDTQMNNESTPFLTLPTNTEEKIEKSLIVLHQDDIGFVGEMGNESMPFPFNWSTAKVIPGSSLNLG